MPSSSKAVFNRTELKGVPPMTELTQIIFGYLAKIGFNQPLYPIFGQLTMGMVIAAFIFRYVSFLPKSKVLARTAYHCVILGFLSCIPSAFAGALDWQHRFEGIWDGWVILHMVLGILMALFLLFIAIKDDPENVKFDKITAFYLLNFILACGVGFSAGEIFFRA